MVESKILLDGRAAQIYDLWVNANENNSAFLSI